MYVLPKRSGLPQLFLSSFAAKFTRAAKFFYCARTVNDYRDDPNGDEAQGEAHTWLADDERVRWPVDWDEPQVSP